MKLIKILALTALLSVLPACAASTKYVSPPAAPSLAAPDSATTQDCKRPIDIGNNALTQVQVEKLWGSDRQSLIECGRRHKELRDFYAERDRGLAGKK